MTNLILPRRKFLTGLFGIVAAPAVVKASNLMPVKVVESKWFLNDGAALTTIAHPARKGSGVCLSELRELLMPGLQKMFDDVYEDRSEQWKSVFVSWGQ